VRREVADILWDDPVCRIALPLIGDPAARPGRAAPSTLDTEGQVVKIARYWFAGTMVVVVATATPQLYAQHHINFFGPVSSAVGGRSASARSTTPPTTPPIAAAPSTASTAAQRATKWWWPPTRVARASNAERVAVPDEVIVEDADLSDPSAGVTTEPLPYGGVVYGIPRGWWVQGEYLMWWPRPMQVPALVTSGTTGSKGVLGVDGTQTLLGGQMLDTMYSGGRFRAGVWTDQCAGRGWEFEFFGIGEETERQTFSGTGATGTSVIARPFFNVLTTTQVPSGQEDADLVAYPGQLSGSVTVEATSRLYGIAVHPLWTNHETYDAIPLIDTGSCAPVKTSMTTFVGWRYLNLAERLGVSENLTSLLAAPEDGQFLVNDRFGTRNRFNGADIGVIWNRRHGRLSLDMLMRVAIGSTRQEVSIAGSTSIRESAGGNNDFENATGGLLAQRTNIGHYSQSQFSAVPELGLTLGYNLAPRWRCTVGYTLLFWSNVVRPGDQIDRDVNPNLMPPEASPFTGLERPTFDFVETDLWVNGINLGLEHAW